MINHVVVAVIMYIVINLNFNTMTQEEKDIIIKKIDSIYGKVVRGGWDYMEGRDDALSELRVFVNNMNITE